jgi:hypothetical protein
MEERFHVLSGRVTFLSGRDWTAYGPGEVAVVPAGTRHAYRNDADQPAHVVCHARPPSTLQAFLEDAAALGRAGLTTGQGMPKTPRAVMIAAVVAEANWDMVHLGFPPLPPMAIQRLLIPPLARMGRRRGYRAGSLAEQLSA